MVPKEKRCENFNTLNELKDVYGNPPSFIFSGGESGGERSGF